MNEKPELRPCPFCGTHKKIPRLKVMPRSKVIRKTVNVTIPIEVDVQLDGDEWFAKLFYGLYGMSGSTEKEAIENAIRRSWPDARIEE